MRPCFYAPGAVVVISCLLTANTAAAQVAVLHSFAGGVGDGQGPYGSLVQFRSNLYGLTQNGGSPGSGTVFQVKTDGTGYRLMHSFGSPTDGAGPFGSPVLAGSAIYGMTEGGGNAGTGTIFRIGTDGTSYRAIHQLSGAPNDGSLPYGSLIEKGSMLYGMSYAGGSNNAGAIFKIATDGSAFRVLHSFTGGPTNGTSPIGSLIQYGDTLYGMTLYGGSAGRGTIFKVETDGSKFSVLHSFAGGLGDGMSPRGSLIMSGSTLYGMTEYGGSANDGTIFKVTANGSGFSVLHSFAGGTKDGTSPRSSLLISGPTLYGMTSGGGASAMGTIFGIESDGTGFNLLHSFAGGSGDGAAPFGDLILSDSTFYGMTSLGGNNSQGTVFSFIIPVPEPSSLLLTTGAPLALFACRYHRRQPTRHRDSTVRE